MAKIIIFLLESILISAFLYLLYLALFRGKASYLSQRIMLVAIPIVATLLATISFDLIELGGSSRDVVRKVIANSDTIVSATDGPQEVVSTEGFRIIRTHVHHWGIEEFAMCLWGVVFLILLSLFVVRLFHIYSLRRVAECEHHCDFTLYRFHTQDILFSFWRSVYLCKDLNGDKFEFVLSHELSHIRKYHYIDKIIIELLSVALWFNPIVRIIQQELSLVHEYEADNTVISSGCDVRAYKMFIFEEVTASVPVFAHGLNGSQIKKRFIAMSQGYNVRHKILRTFATILAFVLLVFSSIIYVEAGEVFDSPVISDFKKVSRTNIEAVEDGKEQEIITKAPSIDARADQLFFIDADQMEQPIYVVRCKEHTKVYIGWKLLWDLHWFVISKETALIDVNSRDKYMLHSCAAGLPLSKVINVRNQEGRVAYFEMIFPPLDDNVSIVTFREWADVEATLGYNRVGVGWYYPRIQVSEELPFFAKDNV